MKVHIKNSQGRLPITREAIKKTAARVFKDKGLNSRHIELSLDFVGRKEIRRLNRRYFHKDSLTDVISFPIQPPPGILGDVVICVDTARLNALEFKTSFKYEICLYIVHGILHLLGYDDMSAADRKKMRAKEKAILGSLRYLCPSTKQTR
ncbi:MAG: rRNA maturation RNase YbeY [Candidatus Omnitrophica bacterium]|nr:rRNA maturation RNase YbeY [Candidatus Omnitrophota bacterium]